MPAVQTIFPDDSVIRIPSWVIDYTSFLRWAESDDAPEKGKLGFINGAVWVDNSMEQILHNLIKYAVAQDILNWNRAHHLGHYYGDGMTFTNAEVELTTVPDGIFISKASLQNGTVTREKGIRSLVISGSPDLIIEVVSRSSVKKDYTELKPLYYQAGVKEYWLIDSRVDQPVLQILERGVSGFQDKPTKDGWVASEVLHGSFKLAIDMVNEDVRLESK